MTDFQIPEGMLERVARAVCAEGGIRDVDASWQRWASIARAAILEAWKPEPLPVPGPYRDGKHEILIQINVGETDESCWRIVQYRNGMWETNDFRYREAFDESEIIGWHPGLSTEAGHE